MVGLGTAGIEKAPDLEKCSKQFTGDLASGDEGGVIFLFMFAVCSAVVVPHGVRLGATAPFKS